MAQHLLVFQPEVEQDHVVDMVVRQEIEQRPGGVFLSGKSAYVVGAVGGIGTPG